MKNGNETPADYVEIFGKFAGEFEKSIASAEPEKIIKGIWKRDCSLWKGDGDLIARRLGWLSLPEKTARQIKRLERFAEKCSGARRVVLIGMGGSVLAAKIFGKMFSSGHRPRLTVLDTTVSDTVVNLAKEIDFAKTFFIVSSKSGRTVETVALADFFFERCAQILGTRETAKRFAAITNRETPLSKDAERKGVSEIFFGDETVGGRFSPLSFFGAVPAAAIGADVGKILGGAKKMAEKLRRPEFSAGSPNTASRLAMAIDFFCKKSNGAFGVICSRGIAGFDRFAEQIIGESVGKRGARVLPVVRANGRVPEKICGAIFVCLKNDGAMISLARKTAKNQTPVVMTILRDGSEIGAEIFRWEMAAAILGAVWKINPFDQPDVENAKTLTRNLMKFFQQNRHLPSSPPGFKYKGLEFAASGNPPDARRLISCLEKNAENKRENGYFSIQAFVDPSDEKMREFLERLRAAAAKRFRITATADFGPAYLHSSGQIHKGDAGNGLFIQLRAKCRTDLKIPPHTADCGGASFEILKNAQALGDAQALEKAGRKVVRINLGSSPARELATLIKMFEN